MADIEFFDVDTQAIAQKSAWSSQAWADAWLFVKDEFPNQRDVVWKLIVVGSDSLHQSPIGLARCIRGFFGGVIA